MRYGRCGCVAAGGHAVPGRGPASALNFAEQELPQRQQEQSETVIGLIAVGMVTDMILLMRQNARGLKTELESKTAP